MLHCNKKYYWICYYIKKYNKLKNALSFVRTQENEINEQISYLESIVYELENSNSMEELTEITMKFQIMF